ncbi:MAG: hypothetical protein H0V66_10495 [Bdellovibrionales bacterium]|nr:hypothetical protein [Bdellovibrionales bacterium]
MSETFQINKKYALSLGVTLLLHALLITTVKPFASLTDLFIKPEHKTVLNLRTVGIKRDVPVENRVMMDIPKVQSKTAANKQGLKSNAGKKLSFKELNQPADSVQISKRAVGQTFRPGELPKTPTALSGVRFGNEELKKMAKESYSGHSDTFAGDKISLKYEVPDGKSLDELNDVELRLYGFLKRGAKNYATSIASELHDFNLKYPHIHFPMTDTKQLMTGRLTYDEKGNLKQIKMIRWTNIDKLQGFFEQVLKRMEVMQNPPKELWQKNGEFTVFVTLQING